MKKDPDRVYNFQIVRKPDDTIVKSFKLKDGEKKTVQLDPLNSPVPSTSVMVETPQRYVLEEILTGKEHCRVCFEPTTWRQPAPLNDYPVLVSGAMPESLPDGDSFDAAEKQTETAEPALSASSEIIAPPVGQFLPGPPGPGSIGEGKFCADIGPDNIARFDLPILEVLSGITVYNDCVPTECPDGTCPLEPEAPVQPQQSQQQQQNVNVAPIINNYITNTITAPEEKAPDAPKLKKETGFHFAYMIGYPDGTFRPNFTITRGEMSALFARLLDEHIHTGAPGAAFRDVYAADWYTGYIHRLTQLGVIAGYPDGTFRPNAPVTRGEFAAVASKFTTGKKRVGGFTDVANDHWARGSIEEVIAEGWFSGYGDGTLRPDAPITRAEAVTAVNKMLDRRADKNFIGESEYGLRNFTDVHIGQWHYYDIAEAANGHFYNRLNDGSEAWTRLKN
ncbi:Endo-1,4-beta-xylanase A precursor [Aedoeadaptatus ivorii]|uniref:Endo-1,4-beta-xylanase A n=1 Tax=Aedoeadaptatus ivorii TaxID=54006 RepID=A0A3S4ZRH5_9FIRM|nr:S-layer homology domain-containing protein [Peptoniphilus ivorii]VEJ36205.1 Endo-1,4-beta-xylanase A precursor [Peptoniphilus ivorii]